MSCCAFSLDELVRTDSWICWMSSLPVRRRCSVRSGTTTVSSRSIPNVFLPFDSSNPTTVHESDRSRSRAPMGAPDPSSSCQVGNMYEQTYSLCFLGLKPQRIILFYSQLPDTK